MSHDDYRPAASSENAFLDPLDSRTYYVPPSSHYEPSGRRSRASSSARDPHSSSEHSRYPLASRQPIDEAVTNAWDKTTNSSYVSPEIIAQITEKVIKELSSAGINSASSTAAQPLSPESAIPASLTIGSPPKSSAMSARNDYAQPSSPRLSPEDRLGSPYGPNRDRGSFNSQDSPCQATQADTRTSSPARSVTSDSGPSLRPKGPPRLDTSLEETPMEKIWGTLFDTNGKPTRRLGQFLRGLAVHLIDDFEPRHSLVVTPSKMQRFYQLTRLPVEAYPWNEVFDDHRSYVSRLYRELQCQHHLVQEEDLSTRPDIPGLTPLGFEHWATLLIQAYPDQEYERLAKAVLDMPISNPDDRRERFPKEISRRLFPTVPDLEARTRVKNAILEHAKLSHAPNPDPIETSPPARSDVSEDDADSTPVNPSIERHRQPYSAAVSEVSAEEASSPVSKPIERERKPYTAKEGTGKIYHTLSPPPQKTGRSSSATLRTRPIVVNPSHASSHQRSDSANTLPPGYPHRARSPVSQGFRASDGDLAYGNYQIPVSYPPESYDSRYVNDASSVREDDSRPYESSRRYETYGHRGDEEYYRNTGRGATGTSYEYNQSYPPTYR